MKTQNYISEAVLITGLLPLAKACGVTYPAIRKWERAGRLPRTEWTGETNYTDIIVRLVMAAGGTISREQLLARPIKSSERAA